MQELSAAWRNMSQREKDRYRDAAASASGGSKTAGKVSRQHSATSGSGSGQRGRSTTVSLLS